MLGYISSGLAESSIILPILLKRPFGQIMFYGKGNYNCLLTLIGWWSLLIITHCLRPFKYDSNLYNDSLDKLNLANLEINELWYTVSNAFFRSRNTAPATFPLSSDCLIFSVNNQVADSVEWLALNQIAEDSDNCWSQVHQLFWGNLLQDFRQNWKKTNRSVITRHFIISRFKTRYYQSISPPIWELPEFNGNINKIGEGLGQNATIFF